MLIKDNNDLFWMVTFHLIFISRSVHLYFLRNFRLNARKTNKWYLGSKPTCLVIDIEDRQKMVNGKGFII